MAENERFVYRPVPCPVCDASCMERWLEDLAAGGLLLTRDGFFCGFGIFRRSDPLCCRYRLIPTAKQFSLLDTTDDPAEDEQLRRREYGWEYVARRGSFHIYRAADPRATDLPTDRETLDAALRTIRRQRRGSIFNCALAGVIFSLLLDGQLIRTVLNFGFWFSSLAFALLLSFFAGNLSQIVSLNRLHRQLTEGDTLRGQPDWRRRAVRHHGFRMAQTAAIVILTAAVVHLIGTADSTYAPVSVCTGRPAFAAVADLGGEGSRAVPFGSGLYSNKYRAWSDPLAPVCMEWHESADLYLADGRKVFVTLRADYYDTAHPLLAEMLARECWWEDRFLNRSYQAFAIPSADELGVDYAVAYSDRITRFPTVILQKDTRVYHAYFSGGGELDIAETARRMAAALS